MVSKRNDLFKRLTQLFKGGPSVKRKVRAFRTPTASTAVEVFKKSYSQVYSNALNAYGQYDRMCIDINGLHVAVPDKDGFKSIKQLMELYPNGEKFVVYAFDHAAGHIVPAWAHHPRSSGIRATVKITFDDKTSLVCTPDHPCMMRDGSYRDAGDLKPGDSMMSLRRQQFDGNVDADHRSVVNIEFHHKIEVGDLTVDGYENFATDSIFVHNSRYADFCFAGDTLVYTTRGAKTFKELVEICADGSRVNVYAFDLSTKTVKIAEAHSARLAREGVLQDLVRVHLDDGGYIDVTPDHSFLTKGNEYVEAQNLSVGTALQPFYRRDITGDGYKWVYTNDRDRSKGGWITEHLMVMEHFIGRRINDDEVVHHRDFDKSNNLIENLQLMNEYDHQRYHSQLNNVNKFGLPANSHSRRMFENSLNKRVDVTFESILKTAIDVNFVKSKVMQTLSADDNVINRRLRERGFKNWYEFSNKKNEIQRLLTHVSIVEETRSPEIEEIIEASEGFNSLQELCCALRCTTNAVSRRLHAHGFGSWTQFKTGIKAKGPKRGPKPDPNLYQCVCDAYKHGMTQEELGIASDSTKNKVLTSIINAGYKSFSEWTKTYENHKVVGIERLQESQQVFNITVEGFHNLAVGSRNTSDSSDAREYSMVFAKQSEMEYCLHGDTKIATPDGYKTIKGLAEEYELDKEFIVYAYDHEKRQIVPAVGKQARQTRFDHAFKVIFDNGMEIIGTPNHRLMMRDGTYRRIDQLKFGDSMMPFYRRNFYSRTKDHKDDGDGYKWIYTMDPTTRQGWKSEHRLIAEWVLGRQLNENEVVHHKNFKKNDNRPKNLDVMDEHVHKAFHAKIINGQKWSDSNKDWIEKFKCEHSQWMSENNPAERKDITFGRILETCESIGFNLYDVCKAFDTDPNVIKRKLRKHGFKTFETFAAAYCLNWRNNGWDNVGSKNPRYDHSLTFQSICDAFESDISCSSLALKLGTTYAKIKNRLKENGFQTFLEFKESFANHKVVSVEYYGEIPLYDLTVDGYKNFATDSVISHNTPEIGSALDIYAEESTSVDDKHVVLHVYSENSKIQSLLGDLCHDIINVEHNLTPWTRNLPVAWDTRIPLLDGRTITIKELSEEIKAGKDVWVYSIQDGTHRIVPGHVKWCDLTREAATIQRTWLDDGSYVDTTLDHEFVMRDGSSKRADQLATDDSLMPFYRRLSSKTVRSEHETTQDRIDGYEKVYDPGSDEWVYTHTRVNELHEKQPLNEHDRFYVTHHIDFNKRNNHPENLQWLGDQEHLAFHGELGKALLHRPDIVAKRQVGTPCWLQSDRHATLAREQLKNHRVLKTELLDGCSDAYCMEVMGPKGEHDRHNFMVATGTDELSGGICLKNCKYGDFFLFVDIHPEMGVVNVFPMPVNEVERDEGWDPTNPLAVRFRWVAQGNQILESWQVAHFRLMGNDSFLPYGSSILESARRIWRQLILIEDAMLVYRVVRSPERRVFYIDVGTVATEEIANYMEAAQSKLKRSPVIDKQTGRIDLRYNPLSVDEDYFIPVRGTESGTKIDTLAGGQHVSDIADVEYIQKKLFAALKVPRAYLGYDESLSCFVPETQVSLLDGRELTIEQMHDELLEGKELWVYSIDRETNRIVPGRVTHAQPTRANAELVRVTIDTGETVDCTPDHKWMLRDGTWCEAGQLVPGASLMPLYRRRYPLSGGSDYEQVLDPCDEKWRFTHRVVSERCDTRIEADISCCDEDRSVIHHVNIDRFDNSPSNLLRMGWDAHRKLHQDLLNSTRQKALAAGKYSGQNNGWARQTRQNVEHLWDIKKLIAWCELNNPKNKKEVYSGYGLSETKFSKLLTENGLTYAEFAKDYVEGGYKLAVKGNGGYSLKHNVVRKIGKTWIDATCVTCQSQFKHAINAKRLNCQECVSASKGGLLALRRKVATNHKIISVEPLSERRQTWCISVEKYENFALSKGNFVSNSKATLAQEDIRFSRSISRIQRVLISELEKICVIHLFAHGYEGDDLTDFSLFLSNPSTVAQMQKLELWRTKFEIAGTVPEGLTDRDFIRKEIFQLTDDQIDKIRGGRRQDRIEDMELEAESLEGNEPGGGGGGGGGGLGGLGSGGPGGNELGEEPPEAAGGAPGGSPGGPGGEPESPPEGGESGEVDLFAGAEDESGDGESLQTERDDEESHAFAGSSLTRSIADIRKKEHGSAPGAKKSPANVTPLSKYLYNRSRRRTHGARKTHIPDFKGMTGSDIDVFDKRFFRQNPFGESMSLSDVIVPDDNDLGVSKKTRLSAEMKAMLSSLGRRLDSNGGRKKPAGILTEVEEELDVIIEEDSREDILDGIIDVPIQSSDESDS